MDRQENDVINLDTHPSDLLGFKVILREKGLGMLNQEWFQRHARFCVLGVGLSGMICSTGGFAREMVDCINPMIGAITLGGYGGHGLGKTFPGAATPFGMIQLSPDTITGGDNGPGYSHHHTTIEGFSFTHMSGIGWYGDLGNFQVMPTVGERILDRDKAKSPYSHEQEKA